MDVIKLSPKNELWTTTVSFIPCLNRKKWKIDLFFIVQFYLLSVQSIKYKDTSMKLLKRHIELIYSCYM